MRLVLPVKEHELYCQKTADQLETFNGNLSF